MIEIEKQNSPYLKRKFGIALEELRSTEEIISVVEEKTGKKLPLTRRSRGLVDQFGCVFPITSHDIDREVDARLNREW